MHHPLIKKILLYAVSPGIVFLVLGGVLVYKSIEVSALTKRVDLLTSELEILSLQIQRFSKNVTDLTEQTSGLANTLTNTKENIDAVTNKVGGIEQTVGSVAGTVNDLKKLAQSDPQLLKKYSKVYFLNENYTPLRLVTLPPEDTYTSSKQEQFLMEAWPFLKSLLNAAKADGMELYVKSGYRSFTEQKSIKSTYSVTYGAGTANTFSADQGYSEHQLGTTVDFITTGLGGTLSASFDKTKEFEWLANNAHRFGFVLSYPKGNAYYVYEPWHWRFVGIRLATYLHQSNINFYDMDQRMIDNYLINTFDSGL
ncbi:MAG: VanY protein [Patescibacteria group bacterium]|nr:VanY protein [Patescibacteria group bacterium]